MRELLALMFCLMSNEHEIRAHKSHILVLTDCISLGMLLRMKDSSSKMLEIALYVGSFSNLYIRYLVGSSLFLTDLLTRQWNKVQLAGDQ